MANDPEPLEDLNARAKQAVEHGKEQVLEAMNTYFNFLQKTISSYPSGGTDVGEKLKNYAEKNIAATHQFILRLNQTKDFEEIVRLQTEFMQVQTIALGEQIKGLGGAYAKALAGAVKAPSS
jgi:hypothetical protein